MAKSRESQIRFSTFPRTEPPPGFAAEIVDAFRAHESDISTIDLAKGLTSDKVLAELQPELTKLGFQVEMGKKQDQKIERPVFYGENGVPTVRYQIDAYHPMLKCGLEVEAGRSWMGNAVYRDLIQTAVMVQVEHLVLAVPNHYKYKAQGKNLISKDYQNTVALADALYGHSRLRMPYHLIVLGY